MDKSQNNFLIMVKNRYLDEFFLQSQNVSFHKMINIITSKKYLWNIIYNYRKYVKCGD